MKRWPTFRPAHRSDPDLSDLTPADEPTDLPPIASPHQQTGVRLASWGTSALLLGCLACGPLALLGAAGRSAPQAPAPAPVVSADPFNARAGEYGLQAVHAWLTASKEDSQGLRAYFGQSSTELPDKPAIITRMAVADVVRRDASVPVWAVTISAEVDKQLRYFSVPVAQDKDSFAALSLPGIIPVPQPAKMASAYTHTIRTPEILTAIDLFLGAYLAGSGDITRIISPGAQISAVTPPMFTTVKSNNVYGLKSSDGAGAPTEGAKVAVRVEADAVTAGGRKFLITYHLTLLVRAGKWEISSVDPTPQIPTTQNN